jgi:hypothetical protein
LIEFLDGEEFPDALADSGVCPATPKSGQRCEDKWTEILTGI